MEFECVRAGDVHRVANAILGDDDVADGVSLGEEDTKVWGVHPAAAVGARGRILAHLEAQMFPATQS